MLPTVAPGQRLGLNLCVACRHRRPTPFPTCAAFPAGIPEGILAGRANHRYPYPCDRGLRFEPDPTTPQRVLDRLEELFP